VGRRAARGLFVAVSLELGYGLIHRGLVRFGTVLMALWLVFWTCAYVIAPPISENTPSQPPAFTLTTVLILLAVAVLGVQWIVSGFRSS
jgi:hypothetical protein